jgi:DNA-binding NtrC family response regulator
MTDKILFVDDDKRVLDGYVRVLHGEFNVETALGAQQALGAIHLFGPYAVLISDMRMPGMNGAELLAQVRQLAPNTVRMFLTGYKDLNQAIDAVNEGHIFRYLTKPCEKKVLVHAINLGLAQYRATAKDQELVLEARETKLNAASGIDQRNSAR